MKIKIDSGQVLCGWFLFCNRPATGLAPHPILGEVPVCGFCAGKFHLEVEPVTFTVEGDTITAAAR